MQVNPGFGMADWELEALKQLYGTRWRLRRFDAFGVEAVPLGPDGKPSGEKPVRGSSSAVLRVSMENADWKRVTDALRPARPGTAH